MAKPKNFRTVRIFDKALKQSNELIEDFEKQGLKASWTSVINTAIQLLHSTQIDKNFTLVSRAELDNTRAFDVGTSIAAVIGALCSAKFDMTGCEMAYHPEVDAIGIRLPGIPDTLIHAGGANPVAIANVVTEQLRSRGYVQDDGTMIVDMDLLLGQRSLQGPNDYRPALTCNSRSGEPSGADASAA